MVKPEVRRNEKRFSATSFMLHEIFAGIVGDIDLTAKPGGDRATRSGGIER
jgi:hypothetical protein